jgi:hypothetical protein
MTSFLESRGIGQAVTGHLHILTGVLDHCHVADPRGPSCTWSLTAPCPGEPRTTGHRACKHMLTGVVLLTLGSMFCILAER